MADIATLGLRVNSEGLLEADQQLKSLANSARSVSQTERQLAADIARAERDFKNQTITLREYKTALEFARREADRLQLGATGVAREIERQKIAIATGAAAQAHMAVATDANTAAQTRNAVAASNNARTQQTLFGIQVHGAQQIGRLNNSLVVMTRNLIGANAVIGQAADAVGTFVFGTLRMTAAFAVLAAVAGAWARIAKEAREARDAQREAADRIRAIDLFNEPGRQEADDLEVKTRQLREQLSLMQQQQRLLAGARAPGAEGLARRQQLERAYAAQLDKLKPLLSEVATLEERLKVIRGEAADASEDAAREETERQAEMARAHAEAARAAREQEQALQRLNERLAELIIDLPTATQLLRQFEHARVVALADSTYRQVPLLGTPTPQGVRPTAPYRINYPSELRPAGRSDFGEYIHQLRLQQGQGGGVSFGAGLQAASIGGGFLLSSGLLGGGRVAAAGGGLLAGAGAGAAIGSVIPGIGTALGAAVGGAIGLIGGLLGHSKKAREEAERIKEATRQIEQSIRVRQAQLEGDRDHAEQVQLAVQHERELADARKQGVSRQTQNALNLVQYEEKLALTREQAERRAEELAQKERELAEAREYSLRVTEDLTVRALRATGLDATADRLSLEFSHRRERSELIASGISGEQLAVLDIVQGIERQALQINQWADAQIKAIQQAADDQLNALGKQERLETEQLQLAQEQLRLQERTVQELQRTVEALLDFEQSLRLSDSLSPLNRLRAAQGEFATLSALARGGDVTAAQSLPGVGRTLIEASRAFNASGPGFQADFQNIQDTVTEVRELFQGRVTVEEQILAELQNQTSKLETQIETLREQQNTIREEAQAQIQAIQASRDAQLAQLQQQVLALFGLTSEAGKIAVNTGTQLLQALALNRFYETEAIPGIHQYWTNLLNEKDQAFAAELTKMVAAINSLGPEIVKEFGEFMNQNTAVTAQAGLQTVQGLDEVKESLSAIQGQLRLNGELAEV